MAPSGPFSSPPDPPQRVPSADPTLTWSLHAPPTESGIQGLHVRLPIPVEAVLEAVRAASKVVLGHYQQAVDTQSTASLQIHQKPDGPVTAADLESNQVLRSHLAPLLPEAGWLSEESADSTERLDRDYVWIVDPLDGTAEFIRRSRDFGISVALAWRGRPSLGVIALPAQNTLFWAVEGAGSFCYQGPSPLQPPVIEPGLRRLVLPPVAPAEATDPAPRVRPALRLVTRYSDGKRPWVERLQQVWPELRFQPRGSTVVKMLAVAAGSSDAYPMVSLAPCEWDVCAAELIVSEAGGKVSHLDGRGLLYNQAHTRLQIPILASHAGHHTRLLKALREALEQAPVS